MTTQARSFSIQLADNVFSPSCAKCGGAILATEDHEYIVVRTANFYDLAFHAECYSEALQGMLEFYKVFIVDKKKIKGLVS